MEDDDLIFDVNTLLNKPEKLFFVVSYQDPRRVRVLITARSEKLRAKFVRREKNPEKRKK